MKSFLFSQMPYLELLHHEINQPEFQMEKNKMRDRIEASFYTGIRTISTNSSPAL